MKLSEFDTYLAGLGKPVESAIIDYHLGCHGGVAHKDDIDFRISYLTKVRELLESHPDAATFAAELKSAYPTLPGEEGVDALAQALCK